MSADASRFIHLRVKSSYSLLEGATSPQMMASLCSEHAMPAVGISDSNNLFGSLEFSQAAIAKGIQPIIGCSFAFDAALQSTNSKPKPVTIHPANQSYDTIAVIAMNEQGYQHLLKLSSLAFTLNTKEGAPPHIQLAQLQQYQEGLIVLTAGASGTLGRLLYEKQPKQAEDFLLSLKNIFEDRLYIELMRHGKEQEQAIEDALIDLAYQHSIPLVATNEIYFPEKQMHQAHDALLCIAEGRYLVEEDRRKLNQEHYFKTPDQMIRLFDDLPEAIENTVSIAKRCTYFSPKRPPILPHFSTEEGRSEPEELQHLVQMGLQKRLENQVFPQLASHPLFMDQLSTDTISEELKNEVRAFYKKRMEYELSIIITMEFPGYFLIVSDFIRWSKRHHIPVGPGRGSGAGSLVAWALEITDLDPLRFGLLFERFLNPERVSMPDFDIDFCQYRRDEVIKYVQQKYGQDRVAHIITFGKLQARAVLRDVGRVMQIPYGQVDRICKLVPNNPASPVTLQEAINMEADLRRERTNDPQVKTLLDMGLKLEGLNRHASTHAAGVVIGDRPLDELVPLYRDPKSAMLVTQYSMKYAEMAGLVKFDFLGLKTLTVIQQACALINATEDMIDISTIPLDDKASFAMLACGDSVGVFQLESAGMRDTLKKMQADRLEDLIALISLYRPGPMDNIPTYIACKKGEQEPDYLHPLIADILKETYGVIIYQEQVMEIAQKLSGYSLGGADLLRRAMGKKIQAEMDKQRQIFVDGAVANKVEKAQADSIFDLVAKFAGYGFNKSHAAAYGMISYQTAYLKANYPVEFIVANMNLDIHDTDKLAIFVRLAKESSIDVLPPDINRSKAVFSIEMHQQKKAVRYGLGALKNVGIAAMELLEEERKQQGDFKDLFNLAERLDSKAMNKRQLESLTKAGVLDALEPNRAFIFEHIEPLIRYNATMMREKESDQVSLFGEAIETSLTRPILSKKAKWDNVTRLNYEYESIGFYLSQHPLDDYTAYLNKKKITKSTDIADTPEEKKRVTLAGIITHKRVKNSKRGKYAFLQLSDAYGSYEVSIFDEELLQQHQELLATQEPLIITANIRGEQEDRRLLVASIHPLSNEIKRYSTNITIHVDDIEAFDPSALKHNLEKQKNGSSSVKLVMEIKKETVTLDLVQRYDIGIEQLEVIKQLKGVKKLEEL